MTAIEETYRDGDIIFEEGNHGDWLYIIESGSVELTKKIDGTKIVIDTIGPGDVFGELGFIMKTPRTADARAVGDVTVGIIDRKFLDEELNKLSSSFKTILKKLALRLKITTQVACEAASQRSEPWPPSHGTLRFHRPSV